MTDTVDFTGFSGAVTHGTSATDTVNNIIGNQATLTISNGSLSVEATSTISNLNLSGGTLGGTGTLTVGGQMAWSGGNLANTETMVGGGLTIGGNVTVPNGTTLAIGTGASVLLQPGVTLSDYGPMTLTGNNTVTFAYSYQDTTQIEIYSGGVLDAEGVNNAFSAATVSSNFTQIYVNAGGQLKASGTTFTLSQLYLDNGSVFNPTDLSGDTFNLPLYLPATDVPNLSGTGSDNESFQNINLLPGAPPSGQPLALNLIGKFSQVALQYVFPSNFTVGGPNGTVSALTVGAGINVLIQPGVTISDYGPLTFTGNNTVTFAYSYQDTTQIEIYSGGVLNAEGVNNAFSAATVSSNFTQIYVNAGGQLKASGTTFTLSQLYLDNGSVFNPTDLSGDTFNLPLYLPATDVPNLSGTGSDNESFQNINLLPGAPPSGQPLALNLIGKFSQVALQYVFPSNFTVGGPNGTVSALTVGAGINVLIQPGVTISDYGPLTFTGNDTVKFAYSYQDTTQIEIYSGGVLNAEGVNNAFSAATVSSNFTQIYVNAGGQLKASGTTFTLSQLYLDNGSVFNPTDLSGDTFNLPLYLPATDVPNLSGTGSDNESFQNINLLPGAPPSEQPLVVSAIGKASRLSLQYVFPSDFSVGGLNGTVSALTFGVGVNVLIQPGVTISDYGPLTFTGNDTVKFAYSYQDTTQIEVYSGGVLNVKGTGNSFTAASISSNLTQIYVNSGGEVQASNSTFTLNDVYLDNDSILTSTDLTGNTFNCPLWLPEQDVQFLSTSGSDQNALFQAIDILPGATIAAQQTLSLVPIGANPNMFYAFPGAITVDGTLSVGTGANVVIREGQTIYVNASGVLNIYGTQSFAIEDFNSGLTEGIVVEQNGSMNVSNSSLIRAGGTEGNDTSQIEVQSGGQLAASGSTFAWDNLILDADSSDSVQSSILATTLTLNAGATAVITRDDFSSANAAVVTLGSSGVTFNLTNNYWGTTDPLLIAKKITDKNTPHVDAGSPLSATIGLTVLSLTKTPTSFTATFDKPLNPADLTIYGNGNTQQDVLFVGQNSNNGQPYPGTLIVDASKQLVTFNVSSNFLVASSPGGSVALPDDTYTVTLVSGSGNNGFQDMTGVGLDNGSGGQEDYTTMFTTSYQQNTTPILGIPDFARGPNASGDTSTLVKVPNDPAHGGHVGIPITIYNASNLTSAGFTLTYNSNILTVTGGISDPSNAGASFTMTGAPVLQADGIHSVATFAFSDATPLSGTQILGDISAYVPYSAKDYYQVKDLLLLGGITVNGGATVLPANAVDVDAYFGDVNGDHHLDGLDKALIANVASTATTGFSAFTLLDPAIIGDVSGDNAVTANSTSLLSNYLLALHVVKIPALPTPPIADNLFTSPFASDPTLSLLASVQPTSDGVVNVPVLLDHARPAGSTGLVEAELTLKYDPAVLSVSAADITMGSLPSQGTGWQLSATVNAATGEISIQLYSQTPITTDQAGSLVNIAFHLKKSDGSSATTVQLLDSKTVLADAQAAMILSPGLDWTAVLASDS